MRVRAGGRNAGGTKHSEEAREISPRETLRNGPRHKWRHKIERLHGASRMEHICAWDAGCASPRQPRGKHAGTMFCAGGRARPLARRRRPRRLRDRLLRLFGNKLTTPSLRTSDDASKPLVPASRIHNTRLASAHLPLFFLVSATTYAPTKKENDLLCAPSSSPSPSRSEWGISMCLSIASYISFLISRLASVVPQFGRLHQAWRLALCSSRTGKSIVNFTISHVKARRAATNGDTWLDQS